MACTLSVITNITTATSFVYDINGTIGTDILTGTVTYDDTLPADGLHPVYTQLNLTLTGSEKDPSGLSIAGSWNTVYYWGPAAQPPIYGVDSVAILR